MTKFLVPVTYTYEAHFLVEASTPQEAGALLMSTPKWQPAIFGGREVMPADTYTKEWNQVTLHADAIHIVGPKAVGTKVKPKASAK